MADEIDKAAIEWAQAQGAVPVEEKSASIRGFLAGYEHYELLVELDAYQERVAQSKAARRGALTGQPIVKSPTGGELAVDRVLITTHHFEEDLEAGVPEHEFAAPGQAWEFQGLTVEPIDRLAGRYRARICWRRRAGC